MEFVKDYEEVHLTLPDSSPEYLEIDSVLENSVVSVIRDVIF